jgi:signal-transduction protein with cAMP-binding, CBS, and nucleotidyltransferase domain
LNKEVLDLPLFEGLPKNLLKYLGKGIETQFAGPNEFLITKDDPLHEVWYISSGSMEVMDGDMVVAILGWILFIFSTCHYL